MDSDTDSIVTNLRPEDIINDYKTWNHNCAQTDKHNLFLNVAYIPSTSTVKVKLPIN